MCHKSNTVELIREILTQIEEDKIAAPDGFKKICWLADMYTITKELDEPKK